MPVFQHWMLVRCHGNVKTTQIEGGVHTQHYMLFRISAKSLEVFNCPVKCKYSHWFRSVANNSNKPWLGITLGTLTHLTHYNDWKQGIRTLRNATCLTRKEQSLYAVPTVDDDFKVQCTQISSVQVKIKICLAYFQVEEHHTYMHDNSTDPPEVWRNVYLVRHGNYRRSCEVTNSTPTPQWQTASPQDREIHPSHATVHMSHLTRAKETAAIIIEYTGTIAEEADLLREITTSRTLWQIVVRA